MYYKDLEHYIIDDEVYGETFDYLINIGWLDASVPYDKGKVRSDLIEKFRKLTLFQLDQNIDMRRNPVIEGYHYHPSGIIVHDGFMRAPPYHCPFCKVPITLYDEQNRPMLLGINNMKIPTKEDRLRHYILPTLTYHYITEHDYLPPQEFLDALEAFDLSIPFDCMHDHPWVYPEE